MQTKLILICGLLLSFYSCKSPEIENQSVPDGQARHVLVDAKLTDKTVVLMQGRLKFQDAKSFQKTVQILNKGTNFDQWESNFPGYMSMRKAYKQLDKENSSALKASAAVAVKTDDNGDSYERAIMDDLLASIVNKDGLLQIGDTLYKVNDKQVMKTLVGNEKELAKGESALVQVANVKNRRVSGVKNKTARLADVDEYREQYYSFDGRLHRFRANWWAKSYEFLGYWSCGYTVTHQRQRTFGWGSSNAFNYNGDYIFSIGSASPSVPFPSVIFSATAASVYESDYYQPFCESATPYQTARVVADLARWKATGRNGLQYFGSFEFDTIV